MYDEISNRARTSKIKTKLSVEAYPFLELNGGVRLYNLAFALSDGLTADTSVPIGALATTTHATGKGGLFRCESLDGGTTKKWFRTDKGYRSFTALISQAGTAAPALDTVYENQLGAVPVLDRTGAGVYTITLASAFAKVMVTVTPQIGATGLVAKATRSSNNAVTVGIFDAAGAAADLVGNMLVEIKVFP